MKITMLLAVLAASLSAESICGKKFTTPEGHEVVIACVNWPAMAKFMPVPAGTPARTQVWVYAKSGTAMRVLPAGKVDPVFGDLNRAADGSIVGKIEYDGIDHTELPDVQVLSK